MNSKIKLFVFILSLCTAQVSHLQAQPQFVQGGNYLAYPAMRAFIERMVHQGFNRDYLIQTFSRVVRDEKILASASSPAEGKPWRAYRPIFLTELRIQTGVSFWNRHQAVLQVASRKYGIPEEYIVAIIGVETFYGRYTGKYNVLRSLTTLAMDFPQRAKFYTAELEHYFLFLREEGLLNPNTLRGSYAGAMGLGQFISSSYRKYAIDFNGDGQRDLWNPDDAIGSIANYFKAHGWRPDEDVAFPARVIGPSYGKIISRRANKPRLPISLLSRYDVQLLGQFKSQYVGLLELIGADGVEYWVTGENFYVITRYNHSPKYAMAVFQLAQEIKTRKQLQKRYMYNG